MFNAHESRSKFVYSHMIAHDREVGIFLQVQQTYVELSFAPSLLVYHYYDDNRCLSGHPLSKGMLLVTYLVTITKHAATDCSDDYMTILGLPTTLRKYLPLVQ